MVDYNPRSETMNIGNQWQQIDSLEHSLAYHLFVSCFQRGTSWRVEFSINIFTRTVWRIIDGMYSYTTAIFYKDFHYDVNRTVKKHIISFVRLIR